MKAEKEIGRRINGGEDPLIVRQNVYSEFCAHYVEAGEEVPPILKSMLDQEMAPKTQAHQPNPSSPVDSTKAPLELQSSGIFDKDYLSYLPSVIAHTKQVLPLNVHLTSPIVPGKETPGPPEDSTQKTCHLYIPSIVAHSRPYLTSWYFSLDISILTSQRTRSPPAQPKIQEMLKSSTFEATNTELDQVSPSIPPNTTLSRKRKRSTSNNFEVGELPSCQYLPSIAAHTQGIANEIEFPLDQINFSPENILTRPYKRQRVDGSARKNVVPPKSFGLKEKSYEEQSRLILREGQGVFVGAHALRARVKGQRGRTKYSRLAIFRSARLNEFTWFLKKTQNRKRNKITTFSENQEIPPSSAASSSDSPSMAEVPSHPPLVSISSQSPPDPEHWISHTSSSNLSPHLDRNELSRKHHMIPKIAENGYTFHDAVYNRSSEVSSSRTSTPGAGEAIEDFQIRNQAIPNLAPSISGFTPINRAGLGRVTKSTDPQKPADSRAISRGETAFEKPLKLPPISAPQSKGRQGDRSSEIDRSSSSQEPEIIGAVLETNEYEVRSIDPCNNQEPGSFSSNESRSNPSRPKPLDTTTKPPTPPQPMKTYPMGPEIPEVAPVVDNERPSREASTNTLKNASLDSVGENRAPIQGSKSRSIDSDSSTGSKEVSNTRTRKTYQSTSFRQVAAGGGSVGVMRRKIIMNIIESCGGVYPGVRELLSPFVTAWMKLEKSGRPDARTVQTAFNYLVCQSCKLRAVTFTFRTAKGVMVTKTMATLMDISPTDQKVKDMQQNIISAYPAYYFPPEAEFTEETRSSGSYLARYGRHTSVKDLEFEKEDQVQLQHKPTFDLRLEQKQARAEMRSELSKTRNMEARALRLAETGLLVRMQFLPGINSRT